MKKFFEKISNFIWKYASIIFGTSLALGVISCVLIGVLDLDPLWYILAGVLGAPVLILFIYLIILGFYFYTAIIKDKIENKKKERKNNNN